MHQRNIVPRCGGEVHIQPQCCPSQYNRVLRPTQVDQLPVLAEIAPPAVRREAATLVLGRRACQHDRSSAT